MTMLPMELYEPPLFFLHDSIFTVFTKSSLIAFQMTFSLPHFRKCLKKKNLQHFTWANFNMNLIQFHRNFLQPSGEYVQCSLFGQLTPHRTYDVLQMSLPTRQPAFLF